MAAATMLSLRTGANSNLAVPRDLAVPVKANSNLHVAIARGASKLGSRARFLRRKVLS